MKRGSWIGGEIHTESPVSRLHSRNDGSSWITLVSSTLIPPPPRYNSVLTYEQADRLLTGGLFGTYVLLIIFGVLFVAIWVHKCHDDPIADAEVAPHSPLDHRRAAGVALNSEGVVADAAADAAALSTSSSESGVIEAAENGVVAPSDTPAADSSDSGVVVVIGDPRSPGQTRRATALAAAAAAASASSTRSNTPSTASAPNTLPISSVAPTRPNSPSFTVGASPSVTLAAIVFHHRRENRNKQDDAVNDGDAQRSAMPQRETSVTVPDDDITNIENGRPSEPSSFLPAATVEISITNTASSLDQSAPSMPSSSSQATPSRQSVSSQATPSRSATPARPPVPTCFSCEVDIDDDTVYYDSVNNIRAHQMAILGMI